MEYELDKIHFYLGKEEDSKMVVVKKSTVERFSGRMEPANQLDKTYEVKHHPTQKSAVRGLAKVLSRTYDDFASKLVEADRKEFEDNNQRDNRYFAERRSKLPGRDIEEANGIYLELHGNRSRRYSLARTMCDVAGVEFKMGPEEKSIEI